MNDEIPPVPCILTINGGSSRIRFAILETGENPRRVLAGKIDRFGKRGTVFIVENSHEKPQSLRTAAAALGGLDALVFAGGIGENAPVINVNDAWPSPF